MKNPLVSVIIPTLNEELNIERLLISIQKQTYPNLEVIVVDSPRTTDKTKEIASKYTKHVYEKGPERSAQRNYGVEKASGEYVLILDADMELTENVIKECVALVENNSEISVAIPEWSVGESYWSKCKALERNFYYFERSDEIEATRFFSKEVFDAVGGYDVKMTGQEDWDLSERVFEKFPYRDRVTAHLVHHEGNVNFLELMRNKYYYARHGHSYVKKHKVSLVSSKTIYFLRWTFYRNWKLWLKNPVVSVGTVIMLFGELFVSVLGFLFGRLVD